MTSLLFAATVLSASLAAEPAKPSPKPEAAKASAAEKAGKATGQAKEAGAPAAAKKAEAPKPPEPPKLPASPAALKDAVAALLGPCSPEMTGAKVQAIEVLDGIQLNALREKEKSTKPKAEAAQRFIKVQYEAGGKGATSIRQISTHYGLTTEQAQKLVGEGLCVFQE